MSFKERIARDVRGSGKYIHKFKKKQNATAELKSSLEVIH